MAPAEIARASLLISHWGNTMAPHNRSTTTYEADRWDVPADPTSGLPLARLSAGHACYEPSRDVVRPSS